MSQYTDKNGKILLEIPFPETKFSALLTDLGYEPNQDFRKASFEQKRTVFLVAFREFLKGNLLLEEFSEISNHLKMFFDMNTQTPEQHDYEMVIYEAADLSYYVRTQSPASTSMFAGFMESIWEYFKKYKNLLENLPKKYAEPSSYEEDFS